MGKLVIAAFVAAIVLFVWGFVSHGLTSLGVMGMKAMPDEVAVSMRTTLSESGLYVYPYLDPTTATEESNAAAEEKAKAGPVLFMAYDHDGAEFMSPATLGIEFGTNLLSTLLAALLLTQVAGGVGTRLVCVTLLGIFAGVTVNVPMWNWYGFSADFTVAALMMHGIGWFLAGIPLALMVKPDRG